MITDMSHQWNLNQFDLNQDGFFNNIELTKQQKEAAYKLTNDVGRNFSFISGLFVSGLFSLLLFISGVFLKKTKSLKQRV